MTSELDVISGRDPFYPITKGRCRIKFLFGSNHHIRFSNPDVEVVKAFFSRMIYIPFNNVVDEEKRDDDLKDKLAQEYDYIFTWAMQGLRRLITNNYKFSECEASEKCKLEAMAQYCPEEVFYTKCIKKTDANRYESSQDIKDSFKKFCFDKNISGNFNIAGYLQEKKIPKLRKRIDDEGYQVSDASVNPINVYEGIRLRKRYRC